MCSSRKNGKRSWLVILAWAAVFVAIAILAVTVGVARVDYTETATGDSWTNPGIRGDFWGGHFAAGGALAGTLLLFAAVLMQRAELRLQREELRLQREEMAKARIVAKQQAEALEEQRKELQLQNALARRRDSMQLIIALADKVNAAWRLVYSKEGTPGMVKKMSNQLQRVAMTKVVLAARIDGEIGRELLDVFFASLGRGERDHQAERRRLRACVAALAPELHTAPAVDSPSWVELAESTLALFD